MNKEQQEGFLDIDIYGLIGVDDKATVEQIKKAYRKKALELHPDKNLDNKDDAQKKFVQLSKAFEILTDAAAKAAYDAVRRNRQERAKRVEQLDGKRKKFKEDLEAREKAAANEDYKKSASTVFKTKKQQDEERFRHEIERLRKEGSKLLEEEMNIINEQIKSQKPTRDETTAKASQTPRLKLNWKLNQITQDFNEPLLTHLFSKYGQLEIVIVNKKKPSAIIEYKHVKDALNAYNDRDSLNEKYAILVQWLGPDLKQPAESTIKKEDVKHGTINNDEHANLSFEDLEAAILKKLLKA